MLVLPQNSTPDILERWLKGLAPGGIPTAGEIIDAVNNAGTGRRAARLKSWAVGALRQVGAAPDQVINMMASAEAASRGAPAPPSATRVLSTPEYKASLPKGQGF